MLFFKKGKSKRLMGFIKYLAVTAAALTVALPLFSDPAAAIVDGTYATSPDGMAAVHINGEYVCSGSIVDQYWVLTARHCLFDGGIRVSDSSITVRVKSLNRSSGGGVVQVATSRVRANYDIAMLKLNRSANAEPVRLPVATTKVTATNYVFGWGTTCSGCGASTVLKRAEVLVSDIDSTDSMGGRGIQAYKQNGTPCLGDSGGPLFKVVDGLRYQVGVTSQVDSNCEFISYYATVPTSRDWILKVIATV